MKHEVLPEEKRRQALQSITDAIQPTVARAWIEFLPTLLVVIGTWILSAHVLYPLVWQRGGGWIALYLASCAVQALFIVRLFVVQHDAGHGGLSPSSALNKFIGHTCSVFEFTPFLHWHRHHHHHHRTSGNLDKQDGLGDIYTLTVSRFSELPRGWQRGYRFFRNRFAFFLILPSNLFLVMHRLPLVQFPFSPIRQKPSRAEWINILALDAIYATAIVWSCFHWHTAQGFLMTYLIAFYIAATIGTVLFFVQHHYEDTYYEHDDVWSFYDSSMDGSMTLRLPFAWMEWLIGWINYHSLHHLKPNIPMYNLRRCHARLKAIGVHTAECHLSDIWLMFDRALWDEQEKRMISFAELDARS